MIRRLAVAALPLFFTSAVFADTIKCGASNQCPEGLPCCSQYGECGVGAYCLGGCDPILSHSLDSCVPAPVCRSQDYKLDSLDGITPNTKYLGDPSTTKWVSSGQPLAFQGQTILTMAQGTVGTLLATTSYVWYGKISAKLKSSRDAGVVTAFILLSDVKDEIDFEFVGTDLENAQSNYYFQGITDYVNGVKLPTSSTFDNYHTYEIDWKPDTVTWSIDGQTMRTLKRSDTWNSTTNQYHYPQTPARVQLSLWPAGLSSNGKGTIEWAGGLVDWNAQDPKNQGYYYAMVQDVSVECYDPPSGASVKGSKSYKYTSSYGTNDTVSVTDNPTILKSLLGTGTNMSADYPKPASSGATSATSLTATPTSEVAQIPGLSGAGSGSHPGGDSNSGGSGTSGSSGTESGSGSGSGSGSVSSNAASPSSTGIGGFTQGDTGTTKGSGAPPKTEKALQGSLFAALVALMAMVML